MKVVYNRIRRQYRIEMVVSGQVAARSAAGPRARMQRTLLDTAMRLMQRGLIPSVSDVAAAAAVSRATAYRYFPSQAAMIQAAVDEALAPILGWSSASADAETRVAELVAFAYPHIEAFEATHRAALSLALDQWARRTAGTLDGEAEIARGHRKALLAEAVAPLRKTAGLDRKAIDRLVQALSLVFGTEAIVVLKDIWHLDGDQARHVAVWAAHALVRAAASEASAKSKIGVVRTGPRSK
jgi:AcrR family transcriptional regulator